MLSKSQVDRLGDRLREGIETEDNLRMLDRYYGTYSRAYETVFQTIRDELGLEPSGRKKKTTQSIREKLRRESMRLSQMQDIAGCRILAENLVDQWTIVNKLCQTFEKTDVDDRLKIPSHGYRAVHVVVNLNDRLIEVQVRTVLQNMWAQLSEGMATKIDSALKYGGGPEIEREKLYAASKLVCDMEIVEQQAIGLKKDAMHTQVPRALKKDALSLVQDIAAKKREVHQWLQTLKSNVPSQIGEDRVLPN